jgi:hypothetical protein
MIQLEDVQEHEHFNYETFEMILGMKAKFRGHVVAVRSKVSLEIRRNDNLMNAIRARMLEELEFTASRLDPVQGNPNNEFDFDWDWGWSSENLIEEHVPIVRETVNWQKEGF